MFFNQGFKNLKSVSKTFCNEKRPLVNDGYAEMTDLEILDFMNVLHQNLRTSLDKANEMASSITGEYDLTSQKLTFGSKTPTARRIKQDFGVGFQYIYHSIFYYYKESFISTPMVSVENQLYEEQRLIYLLSKRYKLYELYFWFFVDITLYNYINFDRDLTFPDPFKRSFKPFFEDFPLVFQTKKFIVRVTELNQKFYTFDEFKDLKS